MSDEIEEIPPIVRALAITFGQPVLRWQLLDDEVIILFDTGQKVHFPRPGAVHQTAAISSPKGKTEARPPAAPPTSPKIQKLPVRRGRKT
jgi:hypothetical protein